MKPASKPDLLVVHPLRPRVMQDLAARYALNRLDLARDPEAVPAQAEPRRMGPFRGTIFVHPGPIRHQIAAAPGHTARERRAERGGDMEDNKASAPADGAPATGGRSLAPHLRIDAYETSAEPLGLAQRQLLHELTVGVLWPHRPRDLDLFLSLGRGYLATDQIGRPVGSAMYFPVGEDFAMLGMMVTAPRLQARGAGKWLLQRVLADCAGRDLRLSATRSGYRLYAAAGFLPVATIHQQQGIARPVAAAPVPGLRIRALQPGDEPALRALDAAAYGAARARILDALLPLSTGMVALHDGALRGFALQRDFGKGVVIGPVVAEDDGMAMALAAPLIAANAGTFTRLDTPAGSPAFLAFLAEAGLAPFDTVTEMRLGRQRRAAQGPVIYGLAAHSLG
ncbi:GNAT family N-acetyltransferase [Paracoccus binzhouensis]|uniref:GNAT family N-acetyltransferase n=1 Tax=Paracoccus binzhouensis TaxID=2796149 RepID=UPI0018EF1E90|nr:GNAT family N-acetyltransferase [Paracoccus binzhouensis]